ncbi:MAG: hypothetical protein KKF46_04780 [Nanoarchaeota archaeon]|nr:hypothetical protein [Nanoarchaeota archaeon]MBU1321648.1 hypothetical protein [Nanoarchaeota archaeon]MBU1597589.1 hypothetical protein [Nanoarchaeota archaeon]MBU2441685.1 hypothetical protein [Nanoarchaeota archaeon]
MAEKKIIIVDKTMSFEGLFDLKDLFKTIMKWFGEHNYDMWENKNYEEVYEDGKKITCELLPYKKVTDYHKLEIRVFIVCENLKEVEIELKGVKKKLLKGDVNITFDANLMTDYENRWEGRATYFFFRTLIDKFIYKQQTDQYEREVVKDCNELEEEIKAYLNMFRYQK